MKELFEIINKNKQLEEELRDLKDNSIPIIEKSLIQKFNLLGRILLPYKEIMLQMNINTEIIYLYSDELDRNIKIKIYSKSDTHWIQISFCSDIYHSIFNIKDIDKTYWIKYPVLQEINLQTVIDEFDKKIKNNIKLRNKNLEIVKNQYKKAFYYNVENDVKLLKCMLNDLFELNNQYRASQDEKLIPFISDIITAMEETLTFKEG